MRVAASAARYVIMASTRDNVRATRCRRSGAGNVTARRVIAEPGGVHPSYAVVDEMRAANLRHDAAAAAARYTPNEVLKRCARGASARMFYAKCWREANCCAANGRCASARSKDDV